MFLSIYLLIAIVYLIYSYAKNRIWNWDYTVLSLISILVYSLVYILFVKYGGKE